MRIEVRPFRPGDAIAAAQILAARHRVLRSDEPLLPAAFEDAVTALGAVRQAGMRWASSAALATAGSRAVGYLTGAPLQVSHTSLDALWIRPCSAIIRAGGHAVRQPDGFDVYRALYGRLAPTWVAAGCAAHYVDVAAADRVALDAWFSLGFGQDVVMAVRDLGRVATAGLGRGLEVRRAGPEDAESVTALGIALERHHSSSPMFRPYVVETEDEQRRVASLQLADERHPIWVVLRAGQPVAMASVRLEPALDACMNPRRSAFLAEVYSEPSARSLGPLLVRRAVEWAREADLEFLTTAWHAANIVSGRCCRALGFRPVQYRLRRLLDLVPTQPGP